MRFTLNKIYRDPDCPKWALNPWVAVFTVHDSPEQTYELDELTDKDLLSYRSFKAAVSNLGVGVTKPKGDWKRIVAEAMKAA